MKRILLTLIILLCSCATTEKKNTTSVVPEIVSVNVLEGMWQGVLKDKFGIESIISLKLFHQDYSEYEIKKDPNKKDKSIISGLLIFNKINKRGVEDNCSLPEEIFIPVSGNRFGDKVFLYGIRHQEELPSKGHLISFTISNTDFLKIHMDNITFFPRAKIYPEEVELRKKKL